MLVGKINQQNKSDVDTLNEIQNGKYLPSLESFKKEKEKGNWIWRENQNHIYKNDVDVITCVWLSVEQDGYCGKKGMKTQLLFMGLKNTLCHRQFVNG